MSYSVGKAIRELNNKNDNIYYLSGDDYFLQKFFINSLEKTYSNEYKTRYFNFEEEILKKFNYLMEVEKLSEKI